MSENSWTLISSDDGNVRDELNVCGAEISQAAAPCQIDYRPLRGGRREGLHQLTVDNGDICLILIPERGMGIWKAWAGDTEIGWQSPVDGPVHPQWVPLHEPSGLGWLEGFDELLVRCGLYSNGAPEHDEQGRLLFPLHGKIAQSPAHHLEVAVDKESGEITVRGVVDERRFLFYHLQLVATVRLKPQSPVIAIEDVVTNLSATAGEMQLLYHINFGPPLLTSGGKLVLAAKRVAPRDLEATKDADRWALYGPPEANFNERVHFFELLADEQQQTQVLLRNADATAGISLCYNTEQLPCFAQWKHTGALQDGYVTGLEPATNFPNPRSFEAEHQRVVSLAPDESRRFDLKLQFHDSAAEVEQAELAVKKLSGEVEPSVASLPEPAWSFGAET